jgi:molecular chaperone DnaK
VTFDIDANGIVNVSAKDKATGKEQQIRVQASGGLSEADIQRMVREAEQHAAEDKKRRELVEARNQADALIYTTEKELKENESRISQADRNAVEQAIAALRSAMAGDDPAVIGRRTQELAQVAARLATPTQQADPGRGGSGGQDEGVVDAEFEEATDEGRRAS